MKNYLTEFIGTFFVVLTVGLVSNSGDPFGGLAYGAVLMVMVYAGARLSGAHYNPAVSLAVWLRGRMEMGEALKYMLVQLVAAVVAGFACMHMVGGDTFVLAPGGDTVGALLAEVLFTFALAYVFLHSRTSDDNQGNSYYGIAIGFTVVAAVYAAGGISGGAFNTAVGLGPMIVHAIMGDGSFGNAWLYLVGPLAGGALAALVFRAQDG